jgi:hypothetical protein
MFSTIKDLVLDRTNRAKENQQRNDGDKHDFVFVERPKEQQDENILNTGYVPISDVEMIENDDSHDSSGSGSSTPSPYPPPSQPGDKSFGAWHFLQCDTLSLASLSKS